MGAWYRDQLRGAGGFDEEMVRNQDDELSYRLRRLGRRVYLEPGLRSEYRPRGDWWKLWRQYFQYGFWKVRILQKHPGMMRMRHFVPSIFVLTGTTMTLAALFSSYAAWGLLIGVVLYFSLGSLAAVKSRGELRQRALLPLVFFALHSSYGAGFLAGMIRFAGKWRLREASRFAERADLGAPAVD
jgi:cellulose synthase/poly-beta-1,6-N-acetylglucosamine synthase-like glycosyltransferase